MQEIGSFGIEKGQQKLWKAGHLALHWATSYPNLFDADDLRLATSQGKRGYHFYEWLGAILLYHTTGFHGLVGKYEFGRHKSKRPILRKILDEATITMLEDRTTWGNAQAPDLLMYAPDFSDYFFCEIKGPGDRLSAAQTKKFTNLERLTNQEIRLLRFHWLAKIIPHHYTPNV